MTTATAVKYYPINEEAAKRGKEMMSFHEYVPGSATAKYRAAVDKAAKIAEDQKRKVDPMYHDKIDALLDTYARRLAENMNKEYSIQGMCPSVMISGAGNFPVAKKQKQNAAMDRNLEEWHEIQGLLDKIKGTGTGGISSDDPEAIAKLKIKLDGLEGLQERMKAVNAYYRKHKTVIGCPELTPEQAEKLQAEMSRSMWPDPKPFESYQLSNNKGKINQVKQRIAELEKRQTQEAPQGWEFDGGEVVINTELNRLQIVFDGRPDDAMRDNLKSHGFRWAPSQSAWQRQLTDNAIYAAKKITKVA